MYGTSRNQPSQAEDLGHRLEVRRLHRYGPCRSFLRGRRRCNDSLAEERLCHRSIFQIDTLSGILLDLILLLALLQMLKLRSNFYAISVTGLYAIVNLFSMTFIIITSMILFLRICPVLWSIFIKIMRKNKVRVPRSDKPIVLKRGGTRLN